MIKTRQIEAFQAVMVNGSISRAAELLNVTQPAVSRLIASLEKEIGFALFNRDGRGVIPTYEAELLLREVETYFFGLGRLDVAAEAIRESRRGHLKISALPAFALGLAPAMVEGIANTFPEIRISLDVHTAPRIADLVGAAQFDFGIAHLDAPRADIEELGSWEVPCVCVMRSDHPLAAKPIIEPRDLTETDVVLLAFATSTAKKLESAFSAAGVRPRARIEAQPSYAAFGLAARGLGVAIIDGMTAETMQSDHVVTRLFKPEIGFQFKLIRPTGLRPSRVAEKSAEIARRTIDQWITNHYISAYIDD